MTAETVIAEIEALPADERAKVFAFVGGAMETDDSWVPDSFKRAMAEAEAGRLVDPEVAISGARPSAVSCLASMPRTGLASGYALPAP